MEQAEVLRAYGDALERLIAGRPIRVEPGTRISNDAVSLEAGRGKGTIKKSRAGYASLIDRIKRAATMQEDVRQHVDERELHACARIKELEQKLDAALAREMSLVFELFEAKRLIAKLTSESVVPIRKPAGQVSQKTRSEN